MRKGLSKVPLSHKDLPYTRQWGSLREFEVWLVDGKFVRDRIDPGFTNMDQHWHFAFIPPNEIWVDDATDGPEIRFLAKSGVREALMMRNGVSYDRAESVTTKTEKAERKAQEPVKSLRLKLDHWGNNGNLSVVLVSGRAVRDDFDVNYTEGGHGRIYRWMPKNEIWIDDATSPADRPFNFLHELFEWNKMKGHEFSHAAYLKAHHGALAFELEARRHPDRFPKMLAEQEKIAGGNLGLERVPEIRQLMM